MRKKLLIVAIVAVLVVTSLSLVACNKNKDMDVYPAWVYENSLYKENAAMTIGADTRVMSYNVLVEAWNTNPLRNTSQEKQYRARIEQAGKMINYYSPDVVGMQEVCEKWHGGLMRVVGNDYSFVDAVDGTYDYTSMIYNHNKVTLLESGKQKYSKATDKRMRYIAWAVFEKKSDGKKFSVINTHFDFGKEKRDIQTLQMKEFGEFGREIEAKYSLPVFLLGDYNAYEVEVTDKDAPNFDWTQAVDMYEKFRDDVADAFVDANYLDNIKIIDGKHCAYNDAKWDHIFVPKTLDVKCYGTLSSDYYTSISDHFPVFVDVAL